MCLGVFLLWFILYGTLCASRTWLTISFSVLEKFSTIISSKNFSYPFFFSSSSSAAAKLLQLCLTLCDPIDGSPLGSSVPGILQARILEWVAISFSNAWKWKVKVKPSGTPIIQMLVWNVVSEVSETVLISFYCFFFILLCFSYFHHSIFQLTYLFCLSYSAIVSL